MRIILDDIPCDVQARTIGEAIDAAASLAEGRGRLVVDVNVGGRHWSDVDLSCADRADADGQVVRFTTARPAELVRQTFADASDALADAGDLQRQAAELLRADEQVLSFDKLNDAISIWLSVQEAVVKGSRLAGLDLDGVTVSGVPLIDAVERLNERLGIVCSALRRGDRTGLADTLLYEFPPIVEEWRTVLDGLQQRLA
jgi:hypothetical protein